MNRPRWHAPIGWSLLLLAWLLVCALVAANGYITHRDWIAASARPAPSGIEGGRLWGGTIAAAEAPPPVFLDPDSYTWNLYARETLATGAWRLRHGSMDNTPFGRDVYWNSGFLWLMRGAGELRAAWTGEPKALALQLASSYVNPVLAITGLAALGLVLRRPLGLGGAALAVALVGSLAPVLWDFGYARPDHHGQHDLAALFFFAGLLAGGCGLLGTQPAPPRLWSLSLPNTSAQARRGMLLAGIAAGAGMWVGATQQLVVIGATLAAAMLATTLVLRRSELADLTPHPRAWRTFALAAAASSLAFFLLESFPDRLLSMRLEVNHPLYALLLWGGGETLHQLHKPRASRSLPLLALALLAFIALPLALALGPASWHVWHDPFMRRMHDFISEFQPLASTLRQNSLLALWPYGLCILAPALSWILAIERRIPTHARLLGCILAGAALATAAMTMTQVRWQGFFTLAAALTAAAFLPMLLDFQARPILRRSLKLTLAAALLAGPLSFLAARLLFELPGNNLNPAVIRAIAARDVAFNLKRYTAAGEPVRTLSGPSDTPAFAFFAHAQGTSALYWENAEGVRAAAEFFSDPGDATARAIARQRGITHIIVDEGLALAEYMTYIHSGTTDPATLEKTLAFRLSSTNLPIPDWLEPLATYGSPHARAFNLRIYRVVPSRLLPDTVSSRP
jgi:hypothetical protein